MNSHSKTIFIRNPHSIKPALQLRPQDVHEVILPKNSTDPVWKEIAELAQNYDVRIGGGSAAEYHNARPQHKKKGRSEPVAHFGGRESSHGAVILPKAGISIEEMLHSVSSDSKGLWLALDCLQDPQNLGAIFRSAAFFGVKGILLTTERSAPMTPVVYDVASGGVEVCPFVPVINLKQALEKAKEAGLWTLGTSEHAKDSYLEIKKDRAWLMVLGNEENGLRRLTEEACDQLVSIPPQGELVTSMNVSAAAAVLMAHLG